MALLGRTVATRCVESLGAGDVGLQGLAVDGWLRRLRDHGLEGLRPVDWGSADHGLLDGDVQAVARVSGCGCVACGHLVRGNRGGWCRGRTRRGGGCHAREGVVAHAGPAVGAEIDARLERRAAVGAELLGHGNLRLWIAGARGLSETGYHLACRVAGGQGRTSCHF